MRRLTTLIVTGIIGLTAAGCFPTVDAELATPETALTYGFVMIHHGYDWWVQIGPKVDGSGTHVAVQAWRACRPGAPKPPPVCDAISVSDCAVYPDCSSSDFFAEYDAVSGVHRYRISWAGTGWALAFDGRVLTVQDPGRSCPCDVEIDYGERTAA